jgi:hypothetical protein
MFEFSCILAWQIVVQDPKLTFSASFEWASKKSRVEKAGLTVAVRVYL